MSRVRIGCAVLLALAIAGCGQKPVATTKPSTSAPSPSATVPRGLVALGHSALTGENADPDRPGEVLNEYNWATGESPEVKSIYQRMVEAMPEMEGIVYNAARGGALVTDLPAQANTALLAVPAPQLVIIRTIDNDIQCDGTDEDNVVAFGETLKLTLEIIAEKSPETKILVFSQPGRPADDIEALADQPDVRRAIGGTGICDYYDPDGEVVPEAIDTLTGIIEMYEAEQERVCAEVPQCATDGGLNTSFPWRTSGVSFDHNHSSIEGHAAQAEYVWPLVADVLGVRDD